MTPTGFTSAQKAVILWRDGGLCCMCGGWADEANHRLNRGMGGRLSLNHYANGCAICHDCNGRIESDPEYAELARQRGVKLREGDDPRLIGWLSPFYRMTVWSLENGDLSFDPPPTLDVVLP